jgi:hypothetical protein
VAVVVADEAAEEAVEAEAVALVAVVVVVVTMADGAVAAVVDEATRELSLATSMCLTQIVSFLRMKLVLCVITTIGNLSCRLESGPTPAVAEEVAAAGVMPITTTIKDPQTT